MSRSGRRLILPEIVQSSAMDCGPAALSSLLAGFGVHASYGRLREACQTEVDGTSINAIEQAARRLGLDAQQILLPLDHLLLDEAKALPAIVVVRRPNGLTHFVVAWRRHGRFLQVMDPAVGRRWPAGTRFLEEVYVHSMTVPAASWREWAGSPDFLEPLRARMRGLGLDETAGDRFVKAALDDPGWRSLAALDASVRMVETLRRSPGVARGADAGRIVSEMARAASTAGTDRTGTPLIPDVFWSAGPAAVGQQGERITVRGAVLVRARGLRQAAQPATGGSRPARTEVDRSPELDAALNEPPPRPARSLLRLIGTGGVLGPVVSLLVLGAAALGVVVEAVVLRGMLDVWRDLHLPGQRLLALGGLLVFCACLLGLELPIAALALRLGRALDVRLRAAFLEKIPLLGGRYFRSRLVSDMTERVHSTHETRELPVLAAQFLRACLETLFTVIAISWLDPRSAPLAAALGLAAIGIPLLMQPTLAEQDLRVRSHVGALSRFYLDSLLGMVAVRAHGAERSILREHAGLLAEWIRATLRRQRTVMTAEALQFFAGFGLAGWLLYDYSARGADPAGVLLLVYWALKLPLLGGLIGLLAAQYPVHRSITLRLLEPLSAPVEEPGPTAAESSDASQASSGGVAIRMTGVHVRTAGSFILDGIDLDVPAGTHVAIVGPSGAGKSSLIGLLLGFHRPAEGAVEVDGAPLQDESLRSLRRRTVWIDPAVQLWNRTLLENLSYGSNSEPATALASVIQSADLRDVVEHLESGLQTSLGEGGRLLSGGEGQRVRVGRGLLHSKARLVLLDEGFRGLDREQRRRLLKMAREWWPRATLLFATHDVADTLTFDRVLVMQDRRIREDGVPSKLAATPGSLYRTFLETEAAGTSAIESARAWRRLRLEEGSLRAVTGVGGSR